MPDIVAPKTQTTLPLVAHFQRFSPRWSAIWVPHHCKPRPRRYQTGGIAPCKGATRRRHADSQLLMLQNPHRHRHGAHRRDPRARLGRRWVAEARQLHTRKVPRRNKSRPTRTTPRRFGTKLSQHTPSHRMCGTKLSLHEPHGPTSGTKLSLLARNGSIWRFFDMQGEFCTVLTTKKPSRENFVPNARQRRGSPTQQHTRPHWCGGHRRVRREWRPGGPGRSTPRVTAITTPAKVAHNFRRSFFETAQKRCYSNEVISMFEQVARELRATLMGERPVGRQAASRRRVCPVSARSAAGERPVGLQAASRRRACPVSGRRTARGATRSITPVGLPAQRPLSGSRAARPCHGLGYSPGAPRRPNRTRRGWTRGRSTVRRGPSPRRCRGP